MNERIKELAEQAYGIDNSKPFHPSALVALEKFAELIVKEAIGVVNNREDFQVRSCVEDLKKHFGMEE